MCVNDLCRPGPLLFTRHEKLSGIVQPSYMEHEVKIPALQSRYNIDADILTVEIPLNNYGSVGPQNLHTLRK